MASTERVIFLMDDPAVLALPTKSQQREVGVIAHRMSRTILAAAGVTHVGKIKNSKSKTDPVKHRLDVTDPSEPAAPHLTASAIVDEYVIYKQAETDAANDQDAEYDRVAAYRDEDTIPGMTWDTFVGKVDALTKLPPFERRVMKSNEAHRRI